MSDEDGKAEVGGPGTELLATASQGYHSQVQLIQHAPVTLGEFVTGLADIKAMEEQRALMEAYDNACQMLISENDVQVEGSKTFKKKSAWRKMARFFHLSTQLVHQEGRWQEEIDPFTRDIIVNFVALVTMRAVAPWGQFMEATAGCSTAELRFRSRGAECPECGGPMWDNRGGEEWQLKKGHFACKDQGCSGALREGEYDEKEVSNKSTPNPVAFSKAQHDCLATAQTRATNRCVSDLIASGEVSWEEVQDGDANAYRSQRSPKGPSGQKGSPRGNGNQKKEPTHEEEEQSLVGFMDQKLGRGKHEGQTWGWMVANDPQYVETYVLPDDKAKWLKPKFKEVLRMNLRAAGRPQPGVEGEAPAQEPPSTDPTPSEDQAPPKRSVVVLEVWNNLCGELTDRGLDRDGIVKEFAEAMKNLPDDPDQWSDHELACANATVNQHGWDKIILGLEEKREEESGDQDDQGPKEKEEEPQKGGVDVPLQLVKDVLGVAGKLAKLGKLEVEDAEKADEIERGEFSGSVTQVREFHDHLKQEYFQARS